ncbi:MAG: 16S rRNA (uracil(1498)-N(3))-methyltransferase [Burkholderiales bacterium]|nr:16S rRNA (uracil(1498)-N(3))-methyltransferase [Burkholderiales bacterium]
MIPRLYCELPLAVGATPVLPAPAAHHVRDVLRLGAGDMVTLLNGLGGEYRARLDIVTRREVVATILAFDQREAEAPFELTVAQSLAAGDKMDWVIEKAVELGAARVQPLSANRSIQRLDATRAARRHAHWTAVARAATQQCGRNRMTEIAPLAPLDPWLAGQAKQPGLKLMLSPIETRAFGSLEAPSRGSAITLLIGPEAGLTDAEEALARACGFIAILLGPRVMRTETAALAALAAIHARWGDF